MSLPPSSVVVDAPGDATTTPATSQQPGPRRPAVPWLAGAAAAAVTYGALATGLVPAWLAVLLVLVAPVLVPSAPGLARRLVVNLGLVVGWSPLLWWVDWGVPVDHGGVVLAAGVAVVVGCATARGSVRAVLPVIARTDLLLPVAGLLAWLATLPLSRVGDPVRALAVLVPGADNWAHFAMFSSIRAEGSLTDALGAASAPDGSGWMFATYPKGFHALAATLSELTAPAMAPAPQSVVVYAHTVALLVVLGTVMVTAAVLAVPRLAERPGLVVPALAVSWTALLWEPGQKVLANGFASFWLGAVAAGTALLLGLPGGRSAPWLRVVTVGGLLVCVAHTWTPLVVVAAPAALAVLLGGRPDRRTLLLRLVVLGVAALAAAKSLLALLASVDVGFIVSEVSGFDGTSALPTFTMLLASVVALVVGTSSRVDLRDEAGDPLVGRLRCLLLAVVLAVGSLSALLVMQVRTLGTTSYYFLKYLLGFELILACVAPALVALVLGAVVSRRPSAGRAAVSALAVVAATFAFGVPLWTGGMLFSSTDDGTAGVRAPYTREGVARGVVAAAGAVPAARSLETVYVPVGSGNAAQLFYPDAWFHAVGATTTNDVSRRLDVLRVNADTVQDAAEPVRTLLEGDDRLTVLVDPAVLEDLRTALDDPALSERLRAWTDGEGGLG